jgi:hypothetical protein
MQGFLDQLTVSIIKNFPDQLKDLLIVFPNKRAGIFFKKTLIEKLEKSTLLPRIATIEEAFEAWSNHLQADPLTIQFELMSIKAGQQKSDTSELAEFAGLAAQMADDFNEIDHQMVDAEALFSFLKEAKALELWHPDGSPLTGSEKKYIHFFRELKNDYRQLNENLNSKSLAYAGKIARELAELEAETLNQRIEAHKVIFAGFNAFTHAESKIVKQLILEDKALIFWDLDQYYLEQQFFGLHEAGNAIRNFMKGLNKKQETKFISNDLLSRDYHFYFHAVTGDVLQAKALGEELHRNHDPSACVVLGDENLLIPVMNSIPEDYETFNATLGFPFNKTACFQFIRLYLDHLLAQQQSGTKELYLKPILALLSHEFNQSLLDQNTNQALHHWRSKIIQAGIKFSTENKLLELTENVLLKNYIHSILIPAKGNTESPFVVINGFLSLIESQLEANNKKGSDFLFNQLNLASRIFNKLEQLFQDHLNNKDLQSVTSIFLSITGAQKVSFTGEPLQGLQIMGLLETRNLSFKDVHILSLNEGVLPRKQHVHSLIPSDIRKTFDLPSFADKQAVTAYHFYRLIQHAQNIHLYYNIDAGDFGSGEPSRYIRQVVHELAVANPKVSITQCNFSFNSQHTSFTDEITIHKKEEVLHQLLQKAKRGFSPSSLAHYLECPLKFYFSDILHLQSGVQYDESIRLNELGTIVHRTLELLFKPYIGRRLDEEILEELVNRSREVLESCIQNLIPGGLADQGNSLITKEVAYQFVSNFLWHEKQKLIPEIPLHITQLEYPAETNYTILNQSVKIKGTIDRIDQFGSGYRLIDYKTGQVKDTDLKLKSWDELLNSKKTKALQLALYWLLVSRSDLSYAHSNFVCGIISLQKAGSGLFSLQLPDNSGPDASIQQIEEQLFKLVEEILDPAIPIQQTEDHSYCKNCDYVNICNR